MNLMSKQMKKLFTILLILSTVLILTAVLILASCWGVGAAAPKRDDIIQHNLDPVFEQISTLYRIGKYDEAITYLLNNKKYNPQLKDMYYADSSDWLGILYYAKGNYSKAAPYFLEAKIIFEKLLGKNHPDYARTLNNLGVLYHAMGDYDNASQYYLEAKNIRYNLSNYYYDYNYDFDYASSLNNIGNLFCDMGTYDKADRYYLEAKKIYEKRSGKNRPDYAVLINNLGTVYYVLGDYDKAQDYYMEAKTVREQTLGKNDLSYVSSLINLGVLYDDMKDYDKAQSYYLDAKSIYERLLGKNHPDYAYLLVNLGILYKDMADYEKAEEYYLEAKTVFEKALGKNHPNYAYSLSNLGNLYSAMKSYASAESCLIEAKSVYEKALGKEHSDYITAVSDLTTLYQDMENYVKAEASNKELCELRINLINLYFSFMSEEQRSLYLKTVSQNFETSYSLSRLYPVETVNSLNYTNTLFTKGLLLRTTNTVRDAIYSSGDKGLIGQFEQLGRLRQQINQLRQKEDANKEYLRSIEEQADILDKSLTRASSAFRDLKADMVMKWQDVRDSLQPGEAALEFVSFEVYDKGWKDTVQYAALVLKPDGKAPAWVPLCNESELKEIFSKLEGRNSSQQARILYNANGLNLFDMVWKPLEKELSGVKTINYSPSGLLHKIAFNALPIDDSYEARLADKYNLNMVSSTREIARISRSKTETTQITSAVLYGGLDYNANEDKMRKAASPYEKDETSVYNSILPPRATRGGAWVPLPATRKEVQKIQGYLKRKKIPNTLYQNSLGNEESFKQLSGKKTGLIHLATHGFFLADVEVRHNENEKTRGAIIAAENPLLRSGLLLAGGNHAWINRPVTGVESGILTADKIAGMNLLGAKLVVMSACQTGLGDVTNCEGVFGLQRAFKLAGVETLIMSLWEVDDAATALLMSTFYKEWLISGKSRQEAFKEAQKKVRAKYPLPYYWAAFVMMD